jgi:hypothetical protein
MPPRYAYWTILIDQKPTAFRAREKEELMPTLTQLRRTSPDAVMKWFARGKLWDTPEQAQWAQRNLEHAREKRSRDWRPGGEHKDPRARFKKGAKREARSTPDPRPTEGHRPLPAEPRPFGDNRRPTPRGNRPLPSPAGDRPQTRGYGPPPTTDRPKPTDRRAPPASNRPTPTGWRPAPARDRPKPTGGRPLPTRDRPKPSGSFRPKPPGSFRPKTSDSFRPKPSGSFRPKPSGASRPPRGRAPFKKPGKNRG